jgi:hypothetical protein
MKEHLKVSHEPFGSLQDRSVDHLAVHAKRSTHMGFGHLKRTLRPFDLLRAALKVRMNGRNLLRVDAQRTVSPLSTGPLQTFLPRLGIVD